MDRRLWLQRTVKAAGLGVAGVLGLPTIITVLSPIFERRREVWRPIGRIDDFPVGTVREASVELPEHIRAGPLANKGVYVRRRTERELIVYSRDCTDLSCPVTWDAGSGWFYCPCHGGIFTAEGDPVAGPPSRPLFRFASRVRDGIVEIDLNSVPPSV